MTQPGTDLRTGSPLDRGEAAAVPPGYRALEATVVALFGQAHLGIALVTADGCSVRYENDAMRRALDSCTTSGRRPAVSIAEGLHHDVARGLRIVLEAARTAGGACTAVVPIPCTGIGRFDAWLCHAWPASLPRDGSADSRDQAPPREELVVLVIDASMSASTARAEHRDLTERVLLGALREEQRAESAERARDVAVDANAERGRLLAATSHELRTPLQAIGGYAELLAMGAAGEMNDAQRVLLANIVRAMHHLLQLSSALLEQGRLEDGRIAYRMSEVDAVALLREAITLVSVQARAKGVRLSMDACDDTVLVHADRGKMGQVLINLLGNAIKFTDAGGSVAVTCVRTRSDRHILPRVEIRVTDTGRGIPADQLERIFDPYVQLKPDATAINAGVGLGLAISRTLARGMGGELEVRSEPGVGSTFTLSLPAETQDAAERAPG